MLDNLALALTHGLMALAAWRLLQRPDLDRDPPVDENPAAPPTTATPRIADKLRQGGPAPRV